MSRWNLRKKPRTISYYEPEEPPLDEYIYCDQCADMVYEYCAIHGPLLVILDDKVPAKTGLPSYVPHAALTIPKKFLHLAPSTIPGAGIGVFSTMTLPKGVRFGPYRGKKEPEAHTDYCWQIYNDQRKASHVIDAQDANKSNWMRYVNCARHWCEQNLLAFQYQGQLYYRTIKIIPRFTEILVFYGSEYANYLNIDLRLFNCVAGISKLTIVMPKKRETENKEDRCKPMNKEVTPVTPAPAKEVKRKNVHTKKRKNPFVYPSIVHKASVIEPANNTTKVCNENLQIDSSVGYVRTGITEHIIIAIEDQNNNHLVTPSVLSPKNGDTHDLLPPLINQKTTQDVDTKEIDINGTNDNKKTITLIDIEKRFSCSLCKFRTKSTQLLKSHIKHKHTGVRPHKCAHCASAFTQSGDLRTHERIHTGEKPYKCSHCASAFVNSSNLRTHERIHTGEKPYKCSHCSSAFTQKSDLKKHERIHTGEKPYKCSHCASAFVNSSHLRIHERIHTGEKPYKCSHCASAFTRFDSLRTHERIHTGEKPYKCSHCASAFVNSSHLRIHERIHTGEKPYKCSHCASAFSDISTFKRHERIHTGEKPYKCSHCASAFTQKSDLKKHERIHTGEKPYKCSHCASAFVNSSHLRIHERIHTGEKPYKCSHCASAFTRFDSLRTHERIHTGEKPYKCSHCASAFVNSSHLRIHERIHTGEKPYKCSHCASAFSDISTFKRHERIHTGEKPYKCSHCASAFTQKSDLKKHERIHTGEKPYKCSHCASAFSDISTFKRHERIHTGEKPYKCSHCASAFRSSSGLRSHESRCIRDS